MTRFTKATYLLRTLGKRILSADPESPPPVPLRCLLAKQFPGILSHLADFSRVRGKLSNYFSFGFYFPAHSGCPHPSISVPHVGSCHFRSEKPVEIPSTLLPRQPHLPHPPELRNLSPCSCNSPAGWAHAPSSAVSRLFRH